MSQLKLPEVLPNKRESPTQSLVSPDSGINVSDIVSVEELDIGGRNSILSSQVSLTETSNFMVEQVNDGTQERRNADENDLGIQKDGSSVSLKERHSGKWSVLRSNKKRVLKTEKDEDVTAGDLILKSHKLTRLRNELRDIKRRLKKAVFEGRRALFQARQDALRKKHMTRYNSISRKGRKSSATESEKDVPTEDDSSKQKELQKLRQLEWEMQKVRDRRKNARGSRNPKLMAYFHTLELEVEKRITNQTLVVDLYHAGIVEEANKVSSVLELQDKIESQINNERERIMAQWEVRRNQEKVRSYAEKQRREQERLREAMEERTRRLNEMMKQKEKNLLLWKSFRETQIETRTSASRGFSYFPDLRREGEMHLRIYHLMEEEKEKKKRLSSEELTKTLGSVTAWA